MRTDVDESSDPAGDLTVGRVQRRPGNLGQGLSTPVEFEFEFERKLRAC